MLNLISNLCRSMSRQSIILILRISLRVLLTVLLFLSLALLLACKIQSLILHPWRLPQMPANNYYDSLFSKNHVDLNRPRSSFPRERKVYTSLDAGKLVPIAF